MRVQGCNNEVDEVECESEVRHQFTAGYKEEDSNYSEDDVSIF